MNKSALFRWLLLLLLIGAVSSESYALQINRTSSPVIYTDLGSSPSMSCAYAAYSITNNDATAYSNLWVTIDSFTNTVVGLGGGDPGRYNLGTLNTNDARTVYFYLQATNSPATNQHTVRVYRGYPGTGTQLISSNIVVTVDTSGANNANKVTALTYFPNPPILGGLVQIVVDGNTGNIKVGKGMAFTPACFTNWNAAAFELVGCNITITNSPSDLVYSNLLYVMSPIQSSGTGYRAQYWFRAVGVTVTNTPVSPVSYIDNGGGTINHCPLANLTGLQPVAIPTNTTVLSSLSSFTQLYTNEVMTFTLRFTNSSATDITLDRVVDTLPAGFSYITNSSTFAGSAVLDPSTNGQVITWSEIYAVPAGTSRDFVFKATPSVAGYATNSVIAFTKNTQIDSTLVTSDNSPVLSAMRVLLAPTAVADSGTVSEDFVSSVSAPGVLGNDIEPNGFALSVVSYTQPAHGSIVVNANGSYTYTPSGNYNGSDSFTYTLTNGNARASTATVSLSVTALNDPPTFTKGPDQTVLEDAGSQIITSWATGISPGPVDEAGQTVSFVVSNNNNSLFSVQPAVSSNGTLTYTPAANIFGSATVTIYARDNGGTANGGNDTSAAQTFTITVTAVNDPPSFTKGPNQTVIEDAPAQSIVNWATSISTGPANESAQIVTFQVSNDNNALFAVQPAVSSNGTLTFTPAPNANGSATVTLYAQDNGGTVNGGGNTSATQTFTITIVAVNDPPTMNSLSNIIILQNAPQQTVNLSGISAGPADETGQTITVTAVSSNPGLIPNPTLNYTSPGTTGTLSFTPVTNQIGSAIITVILQDNGGTGSSGSDTLTNTFMVSVQSWTNVWNPNGIFSVGVKKADGQSGIDYSQTNYDGTLDIQATSANPFVLKLASYNGVTPGLATNFYYTNSYTWNIATAGMGITGFAPEKFVIDTTSFTNDLAGGTFSVVLSPDSTALNLVFTPNQAPVAFGASYGRAWGTSVRIPVAHLLTNFSADADGDARALVALGNSTNHSKLSTNASFLLFSSTNNLSEAFAFIVRDLRGTYRPGDTVLMATNLITVQVTNAVSSAQSISNTGSNLALKFAGVPGYSYDVERSTNLVDWVPILTTNAPANGLWEYLDKVPPTGGAFYRTKQH